MAFLSFLSRIECKWVLGKIINLSKSLLGFTHEVSPACEDAQVLWCKAESKIITKKESEYNADGDKLSLILTESRHFPFNQSGDPENSKGLCMPWACSSVFVTAWLKKNWFGPVPSALLARDRLGKKWQWASFSSSISHVNSPVMGNPEIPLYSCIYSFTVKRSSLSCIFFFAEIAFRRSHSLDRLLC